MTSCLFHSSLSPSTPSRIIQYDEALILSSKGVNVNFLYCNGLMSQCFCNMTGNKAVCSLCCSDYKNEARQLSNKINILPLTDYIDIKTISEVNSLQFVYNSIDDIKQLQHNGLFIGLGALSSYISNTRNMNPELNQEFRSYFDELLRNSIKTGIAMQNAINRLNPDSVYLYNGRFAENRPVWEIAKQNDLPFTSLEAICGLNKNFKSKFENDIPHSIEANTECINKRWSESLLPTQQKEEIASNFYERRRGAKYTGDKIYTANQEIGLLPDGWNPNKRNIVIFNSSEDEFASLGDTFDEYMLFQSQIDGLKFLKQYYMNDPSVDITLRIHPNLSDISYSYVSDLFKLEGNNFRVIEGGSSVSSYTLLDNADIVIVFGSTMGVEANFWSKPVILLAGALYYNLDACYVPKSKEELCTLLSKDLEPKNRIASLKYAFYLLDERKEYYSFINYDWSNWTLCLPFYKKNLLISNSQKFLGSRKLFLIARFLNKKVLELYFNLFKSGVNRFVIPIKERAK